MLLIEGILRRRVNNLLARYNGIPYSCLQMAQNLQRMTLNTLLLVNHLQGYGTHNGERMVVGEEEKKNVKRGKAKYDNKYH